MCSYIVEKVDVFGSGKAGRDWMRIDRATVYYDHPYHAPLDHALCVDFVNAGDSSKERVAVELSAETAHALAMTILAALERGALEHGLDPLRPATGRTA